MADISQNITLTAIGGDEAAAEINKTTSALGGVASMSRGMEEQFSHRFEHIGLKLFAGDMLRTSGLSAEARPIISTLMLSINSLSAAFGAAAGPILLTVAAIAAVVGITMKVIQHHKDEADALQKLADQQSKSYEEYSKEIDALKTLESNSTGLSTALLAWRDADQAVADHIKSELLTTLDKEIAALEKQRSAIQSSADLHAQLGKAIDAVKAAFEKLVEPITRAASALQSWAHALASLIPTTLQHVALNDKQLLQYQQLTAAIAKRRGEEELLANEGTMDVNKVAEATKKAHDEEEKSWEAMAESISKGEHLQYEELTKLHKAIAEDHKKQMQMQEEAAKQVATQIGSAFGNAFAKMIVEGKNFQEEMNAAFKQLAEKIIEDIIKVEVEWAVLTAMGFPVGGAGGGFLSAFGGGFAAGGSAVVDKPTLFLAGEGGPEIATFTPVGQAGGDGGGGGVGQVVINLNVDHIEGGDPASTLDMLSDQIRRETVSGRKFAATVSGVAGRYPNAAY